jgi:hypothetical protein
LQRNDAADTVRDEARLRKMEKQIVSQPSPLSNAMPDAQVWQALASEWKSLAEEPATAAKKPARRRKPTPRKSS